MKVAEIMVRDAKFCHPDQNMAEIAMIMWNAGCGALPVVDQSGRVWSMITDRDVAIALGTRNLRASDVRVSTVAVPRYFACKPGDDICSALKTMAAQEVWRLPVVDNAGHLVGILSMDDIILHARAGSQINSTDLVENSAGDLPASLARPDHSGWRGAVGRRWRRLMEADVYYNRGNLRRDGLHVRVKGAKAGRPVRIAEIEIELQEPFHFDDKIRQGLAAAVRLCLIHNTLIDPPHIQIHVCEPIEELAGNG